MGWDKKREKAFEKFNEITPFFVKPDQLWKFFVTGFIGLLIDTGVLYVFFNFVGLSPTVSKLISTETAILCIFAINEHWTFKGHGDGHVLKRLAKSNSFRLVGLVVGVATIQFFIDLGMHLVVANLMSIALEVVFNYLFETIITWKVGRA